jgi:AcrR family transcriptional regulator
MKIGGMKKKAEFFRKHPKQKRALELVETILTGARQLFLKKGLEKTTTNQIAEKAGISIGSLYRYFPNKESIVAALIDQELAIYLRALDSVLEETHGKSDGDVIEVGVKMLCDLYFENVEFLHMLLKEQEHSHQIQITVLKHLNFEKLIQSIHKKRGANRSDLFEARIFVAVHAVMGVLHSVVERYPDIPDRAAISEQTIVLAKKYLLPLSELSGV